MKSLTTPSTPPCIVSMFLALLFSLCIVLTLNGGLGYAGSLDQNEISWRKTMESFEQIPGLNNAEREQGSAMIRSMNYNAQRIFRKLCTLPGISYPLAQQAGQRLLADRFTNEQVQAFEAFSTLDNLSAQNGITALSEIQSLSFASSRAFRSFTTLEGASADQGLAMIPQLNKASGIVNEAAQAFFSVRGMRVETALQALPSLTRLRDKQAQAVSAYASIPDMDSQSMMTGLGLIQRMDDTNAWNARCLFKAKEISGQEAAYWLSNFFSLSTQQQEAQYNRLDSRQKTVLLKGLYDGGEEAVWKINNLHAVTDANGYEISEAALSRHSMAQLQTRFQLLDPVTKARFGGQFAAAGHGQAVAILKQATSAARVQAARDLNTANMYVVLAQGSELYDSSFREIIVPVMQERVATKSGGDLLNFLRAIDPENRYVSDFISSCAQKGKLTVFFPTDPGRQKEILNLVASSAFKEEDSILLFSATFSHLLKVLEPEARSHLISLMVRQTESGGEVSAKLVRVILQYYLQSYPELLGQNDRLLISRLIAMQGAINLEKYQITPFAEWKQDGRLGSVSMYHPDDDGRQSFASNASLLLKAGYRLVPSKAYTTGQITPALEQEMQAWTNSSLVSLFQAMRNRHFAVSFVKRVGDVTIYHTQFVYSGKDHQKEMLTRFIHSGDEMLAQRGHSYWRSEQIIEPLTELIKENKVSLAELQGKQRFLSLGSCGGMKVYTSLTRLFESSVDILATIGTGLAMINDPYNKSFFEIVASNPSSLSWKGMAQQTSYIFEGGRGQDYLQPGSLTAILHKIVDEAYPSGSKERRETRQPSGRPIW